MDIWLIKASSQVSFCKLVFRIVKEFDGIALFNNLSQIHKNNVVGNSSCLPQGMCNKDYCIMIFKLNKFIFDGFTRQWVQRRCGFVGQDNLRIDRQATCQT